MVFVERQLLAKENLAIAVFKDLAVFFRIFGNVQAIEPAIGNTFRQAPVKKNNLIFGRGFFHFQLKRVDLFLQLNRALDVLQFFALGQLALQQNPHYFGIGSKSQFGQLVDQRGLAARRPARDRVPFILVHFFNWAHNCKKVEALHNWLGQPAGS